MSISREAEAILRAFEYISGGSTYIDELENAGLIKWVGAVGLTEYELTPAGRDYLAEDKVVIALGKSDYIETGGVGSFVIDTDERLIEIITKISGIKKVLERLSFQDVEVIIRRVS